jgi:hypothetical protein
MADHRLRWSAPQYRAVGLGRDPDDFGDAEIGGSEFLEPADDLVGVRAAGAGMLLAELIPGEVQGFDDDGGLVIHVGS